MANITPAQAQAISKTLSSISTSLGNLTPAQRQQFTSSGAASQLSSTLSGFSSSLGGGTDTIGTQPIVVPVTTPPQEQTQPTTTTPTPLGTVSPATTPTPPLTTTTPTSYQAPTAATSQTTTPTQASATPSTQQDPTAQKYQTYLQAANQSGVPAPATGGSLVASQLAQQVPTDTGAYQPSEPFMTSGTSIMDTYIQSSIDAMNEINQKGYTVSLMKSSGEAQLANLDQKSMNIQNIMDGTQDDIRAEITKAGGFATESQVQALTVTRNKDLVRQYNSIQLNRQALAGQLNAQIGYAEADLQYAQGKYDNATNSAKLYQTMQTNATDMFQKQVAQYGYQGLAKVYAGNPRMLAYAGQMLFQDPWILFDKKAVGNMDTYRQQSMQQSQQRIYIQMQGQQNLQDYRGALAASRYATAVNSVVKNYLSLPTYKLYSTAIPYLAQIKAADTIPGSVSDRDLLDAVTKINTGGNQVTEAQVALVTGGRSLSDSLNVWGKKLSSGGVLSTDQRKQLTQLANKIYANYDKGYSALKGQIQTALDAKKEIPDEYKIVPDLSELAGATIGGSIDSSSATINGIEYYQASDGKYYPK